VGPRKYVLDGGPDSQEEGATLGVVRSIEKQCESLLRCTQQTKSITVSARLLQSAALLPIGRCLVKKFDPLQCGLSIKNSSTIMSNIVGESRLGEICG